MTGLCYPNCRLKLFANSFFPSQTKLWNSLIPELRECKSLEIFRRKVNKNFNDLGKLQYDTKAYATCTSYYGNILTQIRLELSHLRQQMFVHNLTDNPFCPSCGTQIESVCHFLLNCVLFDKQRGCFTMNYGKHHNRMA